MPDFSSVTFLVFPDEHLNSVNQSDHFEHVFQLKKKNTENKCFHLTKQDVKNIKYK